MIGNGIQVHLNGGVFKDGSNEYGLFSICSWYDRDIEQVHTGYYTIGSMH